MNAFIIAEKVLALAKIALRVDTLIEEVKQYKNSTNGNDADFSEFIDKMLDREIDTAQQNIDSAKAAKESGNAL